MVIKFRYRPKQRAKRIMQAAEAKAARPETGEVNREAKPPKPPSTPSTNSMPVRKRGTRLSGVPVRAEAFTQLMVRITASC